MFAQPQTVTLSLQSLDDTNAPEHRVLRVSTPNRLGRKKSSQIS
jgi:hypothetical protein